LKIGREKSDYFSKAIDDRIIAILAHLREGVAGIYA